MLTIKQLVPEEAAAAAKKDDAWAPELKNGSARQAKARLVILDTRTLMSVSTRLGRPLSDEILGI